jgi:hypothetical protein
MLWVRHATNQPAQYSKRVTKNREGTLLITIGEESMSRTRVVSYIDDEILKALQELIDIGCRVKQYHDTNSCYQGDRKSPLIDKHREYLLKIMALAADIYRCLGNEKSKYSEETIENVLVTITANAQSFIDRQLERI